MPYSDIPIIKKIYELYKLLYSYRKIIPKFERYTIWQERLSVNMHILKKLIQLGNADPTNRHAKLADISSEVDLLKILIRLSFEINAIDNKKYIAIQTTINEIGKMLGGWIKSTKNKS